MSTEDSLNLELVRTVTFSAAHRYASPSLSDDENRKVFGSLYRDDGFGHNFLVEAHFFGRVDPLTGMIANLVDIDRWLKNVASLFDHKFLNELPEFSGAAPTLEKIALAFFERIEVQLKPGVGLVRVRLYEGEQTWVDCISNNVSS